MKKSKKLILGFTLIEIIVVISIIIIVSSVSVFYFVDGVKQRQLESQIKTIHEQIQHYSEKVKNGKIFDYKIVFSKTSGNIGFIVYENLFDINYEQTATLDDSNYNLNIIRTSTGYIEIFEANKLQHREALNTNSYSFTANNNENYKVSGEYLTASGELNIYNNIILKYYHIDNIDNDIGNNIQLVDINSQNNGKGVSYNNLSYENINQQIGIAVENETTQISKAYLIFELGGKYSNIELNTIN